MLNASIDAQLGEAILSAARGEPIEAATPELGQRAEQFIKNVDHHADREQWLTVLAYTLERVNGRADYLYANVFKHRLMSGQRQVVNTFCAEHLGDLGLGLAAYKGDPGGARDVLKIGTDLLRGNFREVHEFAEKHNQPLTLPGKQIAAGVRLVQLRNIGFNRKVAKTLHSGEESTLPKVLSIRAAAESTRHPNIFINAAALTQRAAARWDRAFAMLLRARFRI
jgi:hypothetical protein